MTQEDAPLDAPVPSTKAPQQRRRKTEQRILTAVRTVLSHRGFDNLGVNSVAQEAGVSKELIYRYFGDLETLVLACMRGSDAWQPDPVRDRIAASAGQKLSTVVTEILLEQERALRHNKVTQEIRRWEIAAHNHVTETLGRQREIAGRMMSTLLEDNGGMDAAAVFGLLSAGLTFLVLRSRVLETYMGIPVHGDLAWHRWEKAAAQVMAAVCEGRTVEASSVSPKTKATATKSTRPER